jgi:hypothetical protein
VKTEILEEEEEEKGSPVRIRLTVIRSSEFWTLKYFNN